jgi:DNA-binding MarR family transcriptional regulator
MSDKSANEGHSSLCLLRLMKLFPRVSRGMRRQLDEATPATNAQLGPRHAGVLEQLRDEPMNVGALASTLGLSLSTVSGLLADLDRAGFVHRNADDADRRRTVVALAPAQRLVVEKWLDGSAAPLARALAKLQPAERDAFLKAMDLLEAELEVNHEVP